MITITIIIGNSDDKLTQVEWSRYVDAIDAVIQHSSTVHFHGAPAGTARWQNAAWVIEMDETCQGCVLFLKAKLSDIRRGFNQTSVAWIEGKTEFI